MLLWKEIFIIYWFNCNSNYFLSYIWHSKFIEKGIFHMIKIIIAIILILASIGSLIYSIIKTPERLRGYYGKFYIILVAICLIASISLIIF